MKHQGAYLHILLAISVGLMPRGESGVLAAQAPGISHASGPCAVLQSNNGQLPRVVVNHRSLDRVATCSIRLRRGDQLWVQIVDANELIYEYKLVDVEIPVPTPPQAFAAFLSATTATSQAAVKEQAAQSGRGTVSADTFPADPNQRVQRHRFLAGRLMQAALAVRPLLDTSEAIGPDTLNLESLQTRIHNGIGQVVQVARAGIRGADSAQLHDLWRWTAALRDSIRGVPPQASAADQAQVERDHDALARLYPDAANLARQLADLRLGKLFLLSNDRSGTTLVRLSVKPRLSADYRPARVTTSAELGLNILRIGPAAPWFQASAGLSWTPEDGRLIYHERTSNDTTFFETKPRDRLTPVAGSYFGLEWPLRVRGRDCVFGLGAGAGLRIGAGDLQLSDALDYSLFFTVGYEWLRVHLGRVWSAEVDEASLPARYAAGVRFTTANRRLSDYATRRKDYWFIGVARTL